MFANGLALLFFVHLLVSRALGQTHFLPSFGLRVGLINLAMCVAVRGWVIHCQSICLHSLMGFFLVQISSCLFSKSRKALVLRLTS